MPSFPETPNIPCMLLGLARHAIASLGSCPVHRHVPVTGEVTSASVELRQVALAAGVHDVPAPSHGVSTGDVRSTLADSA